MTFAVSYGAYLRNAIDHETRRFNLLKIKQLRFPHLEGFIFTPLSVEKEDLNNRS